MKNLTRYNFSGGTTWCGCDMDEHPDGEYVKFSDVMEALTKAPNNARDEIAFLDDLLKCEDNDLCSLCRIDIEVRRARLSPVA